MCCFVKILFKWFPLIDKHWVHILSIYEPIYYLFTNCLFVQNSRCIWSQPLKCLPLAYSATDGREDIAEEVEEGVHIQDRDCQERIHINLEKVTQFAYLPESSAALKCLQHRGTDHGQPLVLFVCLLRSWFWLFFYYQYKSRSILRKGQDSFTALCSSKHFFNECCNLCVWKGVLLRYYRLQGEEELNHK